MSFKYLIKTLEEVMPPETGDDDQPELIVEDIKAPKEEAKPKKKYTTVAGCDDLGAAMDFIKRTLVNRYAPEIDVYIFTKDKVGAEVEVDHFPGALVPSMSGN